MTGLGHEEMNMVKSFTEMFFDFILSEFFEIQGYSTPKSIAFAKRCFDNHIAFDNLLKFRESVYAFRISNQNKVEQNFGSFCKWIDGSGDQTLHFIYHIVLPCLMFQKVLGKITNI